jgi:hypothetical protein
MVVIEGNGTAVITAGPSDVVVRDGAGLTIARIPGCSERAFTLAFPIQNPATAITIEALEGGGGMVFNGYRPIPAIGSIEIEPVTQDGVLVFDGKKYFIQGVHASVTARVRDPAAEGWSHAGQTVALGDYPARLVINLPNGPFLPGDAFPYWCQSAYTNREIGAWSEVSEPIIDYPVRPPNFAGYDEIQRMRFGAKSGSVVAVSEDIFVIPNEFRINIMRAEIQFLRNNGTWTNYLRYDTYGLVACKFGRPLSRNPAPYFIDALSGNDWSHYGDNNSQSAMGYGEEFWTRYGDVVNLWGGFTRETSGTWSFFGYQSARVRVTQTPFTITVPDGFPFGYTLPNGDPIVTEYLVSPVTNYRPDINLYDVTTWPVVDSFVLSRRFPL